MPTTPGPPARRRAPQRRRPAPRPTSWAAYAGVGLVLVLQLVASISRRWVQEDGFINIRIAQQVLAGNGAVFNVGERVEAFTSPLWLGLLVVARVATFGQVRYEWLAVGLGVVLSLVGTAGLMAGSMALWTPARTRTDRAWWLPLGILVPLAIPTSWDFATSGLETGLAWGWLGASFAVVARSARTAGAGGRVALGPPLLLVGLGPLVRPELGLYAVAFGLALVRTVERPARRAGAGTAAWRLALAWGALPVAYQVFRMGYYATLVPTTALAKNAGDAVWARGTGYLLNFTSPYRVLVPLAVLVLVAATARPLRRPTQQVLAAAIVGPGLLQALYVVWVGGDYMHGRFWLVPLLALVAPVAVVPLPRGSLRRAGGLPRTLVPRLAGVALVAVWAVACAAWWRGPILDDRHGTIDDQRALITQPVLLDQGLSAHPVLLEDQPYMRVLAADIERARAGDDVFVDRPDLVAPEVALYPRPEGTGTAVRYDAIGVTGVAFGPDVFFVDRFGLADPVAARLPPESQARAGHTHDLPVPWRFARAGVAGGDVPEADQVAMARRAMGCGQLGRLLRGIHEPLTPGRFLANVWSAPANTTLEIPEDPAQAERTFCTG